MRSKNIPHKEIEKVDVFRKVLDKQFIEKLRAIFITNETFYIINNKQHIILYML